MITYNFVSSFLLFPSLLIGPAKWIPVCWKGRLSVVRNLGIGAVSWFPKGLAENTLRTLQSLINLFTWDFIFGIHYVSLSDPIVFVTPLCITFSCVCLISFSTSKLSFSYIGLHPWTLPWQCDIPVWSSLTNFQPGASFISMMFLWAFFTH